MKGLVTVHDATAGTRFTAYLEASDTTPLSSIMPSLSNITGAQGELETLGIAVDGKTVTPDTTVGQCELHEGSWLSLMGRGAKVMNPYANTDNNDGFVQLRFVSGVNAGAIYDVSQGTMSISSLLDPEKNSMNADFMLDVGADGDVRMIPHVSEGKYKKREHWYSRRKREIHSNVFINGKEAIEPVTLKNDTEVVLPECIVEVTHGRETSVPVDTHESEGHWLFARPPKIREVVKQRKFVLPVEPTKPEKMPIPLMASLLPLVMAVGMCVLLKSYTYLMFGLMSPVMMIGSYVSGNHAGKKRYKKQMKRFHENSKRIRAEASKAVDAEEAQSRLEYPDPTQVLDICARHTKRLWNRRSTDESWLRLRVGAGTVDSHITLEDPQKMEFERIEHWRLRNFPVTVSLPEAGCVGCTGNAEVLYPVVSWMTAQMAALHSTRDLALYLLTPRMNDHNHKSDFSGIDWSFAQWFPQFTPHSGQNTLRTMAVTADDLALRISELVAVLDERASEKKRQSVKHWVGSAVVVIMERAHVLRSMPGVIRLLQEGPALGMYSLCIDTDERMLPEECQTVITATDSNLRVESNIADDVFDIMPDLVSSDWLGAVGGALAPIEDGSPSEGQTGIPDQSRLLDLLNLTPTPDQIEARWAMYPRSTSCLIGESVDGPFGLDIAKDGPHGLIGGTTGSGKSELLQSLVASLAVANTPQALNFVLVDYKGGAAFKDCVKLPHTVGMVTDLDNHLVSRALTSLGAELNYREHLLAKAGAKDLEDYIDMREAKPSLPEIPRLLIVIDEFASLARELPDFVTGLVNIAQRGRSLGIHLLLATQRPGGVVSPEIRANTNLRIALRMTDASESQDVIDAKDAALISKSTPGRAVVRLGSSSLIPFQSARVGGRYINPATAKNAGRSQAPFIRSLAFSQLGEPAPQRPRAKKDKGDVNVTDLKVLVDAINKVAERERIPKQRQPWLPALPEQLDLQRLQAAVQSGQSSEQPGQSAGHVVIPFALGDYPQQQQQQAVTIDASSFGNMFIVGTSRSGKSTALRTIAYAGSVAYSPRKLHIYCIDGGNGAISPLSALPNVGAVALRSETQKIERLIGKLEAEAKHRSSMLSKDGFSSIDEYNGSESAQQNGELPHILVMLDSWDGFNSFFQGYDGGSLIERLQILMREGPSSGIHFIVTGDHLLLAGRMAVLSDSKVLLRLVDPSDYTEVGMSSRDVPENIPDGRGYRSEDGAEIQVAQIRQGLSGQAESELIRATGAELKAGRDHDLPRAVMPFRVEQLPQELSLEQVHECIREYGDEFLPEHGNKYRIPLGIGGEDNEPILFDPGEAPMLPIYGTQQSGKTSMLVTIVNGALLGGYHVVIVAPKNNDLRKFEGASGVDQVITEPSDVTEDLLSSHADDSHMLFVFDDCQLLKDIPASDWLQSQIGVIEGTGAGFVFAGDIAEFPTGFGNWGSKIKTLRQGVMLKPDEVIYQDLINIRLRRADLSADMPAGRGFIHLGGLSVTMQVALSVPGESNHQLGGARTGMAQSQSLKQSELSEQWEQSVPPQMPMPPMPKDDAIPLPTQMPPIPQKKR
ncbi:cell division protein FtsK [Bifidobacterium sp. LC6]|uniref:Cell division protein FtsK n=1 Tax=Bifidobacterium colobi TaxID=2809026 RepID=A0ABS5UTX9_9BIFI|nr:FtsK/SpoIIIE domain-containing protein [Bifidobacterium colobi]MBT1174495.1 cell division protein FtsK [Bifidobacterium colobi]